MHFIVKILNVIRWKVLEDEKDKIFIGVLEQNLVLLKQDSDYVYYSSPGGKIDSRTLQDYFSLSVDLETLYDSWSKAGIYIMASQKNTPPAPLNSVFGDFFGVHNHKGLY